MPITWDAEKGVFASPKRRDLEHLARWSGPSVDAWARCDDSATQLRVALDSRADDLRGRTRPGSGRSACGKPRNAISDPVLRRAPRQDERALPAGGTAAHRSYMAALNGFHRVIAISEMSRVDLASSG